MPILGIFAFDKSFYGILEVKWIDITFFVIDLSFDITEV